MSGAPLDVEAPLRAQIVEYARREAILVAENESLRRDLAGYVAGTATIESLTAKYGTMDAALGGHITALMAELMVSWFDESGGENYVEVKLRDRKSAKAPREFALTVQRVSGKTPHELRDEAEAKVGGLLAEVARLQKALVECAIPYEAILMDAPSRKWIAPRIWAAMEKAVRASRGALGGEPE